MFEPTRLAATHLADAYTQVVPLRPPAGPLAGDHTPVDGAAGIAPCRRPRGLVMTALAVALYARVSSAQQAQAQTIDSQLAALRERIAHEGGLGPEHEFIDAGYSGSTLIRPALERLRDAVAAGEIERCMCIRRIG